MKTGGIILCGGQSSRMGRPKAWLPIGDQIMLPWIVAQVQKAVSPIVVVAAPDQDLPPLHEDIMIVRDERPGQGPLEGMAAGFSALKGRCDAAYLSSCDVPFLQPAFITRLIALLTDHDVVVPHVEGRYHPLAAVYRLSVLPTVRRLIEAKRMRPMFLFDECRSRIAAADDLTPIDPDLRSLRNINTPEEYDAAVAEWH